VIEIFEVERSVSEFGEREDGRQREGGDEHLSGTEKLIMGDRKMQILENGCINLTKVIRREVKQRGNVEWGLH